jgi:hypothetical protein
VYERKKRLAKSNDHRNTRTGLPLEHDDVDFTSKRRFQMPKKLIPLVPEAQQRLSSQCTRLEERILPFQAAIAGENCVARHNGTQHAAPIARCVYIQHLCAGKPCCGPDHCRCACGCNSVHKLFGSPSGADPWFQRETFQTSNHACSSGQRQVAPKRWPSFFSRGNPWARRSDKTVIFRCSFDPTPWPLFLTRC